MTVDTNESKIFYNNVKKEKEDIIDKIIQNGYLSPKEIIIIALSYEKLEDGQLDDDDKLFYRCLIG